MQEQLQVFLEQQNMSGEGFRDQMAQEMADQQQSTGAFIEVPSAELH